ncbi:cytochrome o ubiquinol oxidase subunit IV [Pararhizobium antarcticum]|uniref:Cytochrome bo(3) ubiquinol oxidase subunit 4 n=1 Tax=Pararhizobium antarcticum TaxID=1798805 RepID=A0A657LRM2_9HYPH|nr:cytochrome o ubiquinol oxidase subunit IV [Pararhizobium antarcticum]OJF96389.1 cytochrome o ubiquinol oxidase subunit IV [Pararhizobium antarcticum]OJF96720.1 cytochrome o ubiquinol oxidase subunit IV [Rhizobium sp. 58]
MSQHSIKPHSHRGEQDEHGSTGHDNTRNDHGSYRSYFTGFVLAVILTVLPFAIVMTGGFESRVITALTVIVFAVAQVLVHMVYFLHMNSRSDEGWTLLSMIFTVIVVVIMISGSLWVMYNMNTNMMPQMEHENFQGFGS